MYMNKPDHKPGDERGILMAFDRYGVNQFVTGFYDIEKEEYYTHDGEYIHISDMVAWDEKPTIEFLQE